MTEESTLPPIQSPGPTALRLAIAIALGVLHALWSLFQWTQLVAARTGGDSFCGLGDGGQTCAAVWDSALASTVQGISGLPVAGWGLVWSLVAIGLPLAVLTGRAVAPAESSPSRGLLANAWPATLIVALSGLATVVGLLAHSLSSGRVCTTCAVTYAIVLGYAVVCLYHTAVRGVGIARGISLASACVALAFVLLFVPGLRTPESPAVQGQRILDEIAARQSRAEHTTAGTDEPAPEARPPLRPEAAESIAEMLAQLPADARQAVSDGLEQYRNAPTIPSRPPRTVIGSPEAPVRITEFTDVLCSHCATLHETVTQLRSLLPLRAFSLEPRYFPLDSACNAELKGSSTLPVRCTAARAQLCLEDQPDYFDFVGSLFLNRGSLDDAKVYELAEPLLPRAKLDECMRSPVTAARLKGDIAWASEHRIGGTPLVLLNGREVASFGPLLYSLILTQGDASGKVFEGLPPPQSSLSKTPPLGGH